MDQQFAYVVITFLHAFAQLPGGLHRLLAASLAQRILQLLNLDIEEGQPLRN
jgi:hypothetical protein